MQIHQVQRSNAPLPLEKLAGNSQLSQPEKLAEVSRQFEAVLLRKILSEAQKPVFASKFNQSSVAGDVYRDLITSQMADQISRSGALGLGRSLETQLQRETKVQDQPPAHPTQPKPLTAATDPCRTGKRL